MQITWKALFGCATVIFGTILGGPALAQAPSSRPVMVPTSRPVTATQKLVYPDVSFMVPAEDVLPACQQALAAAKAKMDSIVARHKDLKRATFANTVEVFERALAELDEKVGAFYLLKSTSPDAKIRKACAKCLRPYMAFWSTAFTRADLYRIFQHVATQYAKAATTATTKTTQPVLPVLSPNQRFLLKETVSSFVRNGAALAPKERKEVRAMSKKLSALSLKFYTNLSQDKTTIALTKKELEGVPTSVLKQLSQSKDKKHYLVKVKIASQYLSIMRYAKNPLTRKKVLVARGNMQAAKNIPVLEQVIALRHRIARKLGYYTHAHKVLSERMAKKPSQVYAFLYGLWPGLREKMQAELKVLLAMKQKDFPKATEVHAWDWRYYGNLLKKKRFSVDDEAVRQYFPMDHVIKTVFAIYQQLLGVTFQEIKPAKAWHPDVRLFGIVDNRSKTLVAHFYLDLYPRPGKYTHFAAFGFRSGRLLPNGTYRKPVSSVVGNWSKPVDGKDALISLRGVETFFHEFGHIMHQTLTRSPYASMAGTSVKRDFVEAPSQMLENWLKSPALLKKLSKHHKTGKPLPDALIQKVLRSKKLNRGLFWSRQLFYAMVDIKFHTYGEKVDTARVWRSVTREIMPVAYTEGTQPAAGFGHLMGYSAGYYGYLWSKVYAQDMFTVFEREGLLSPQAGMRYRRWILEKGGTQDPMSLLRGFLGRDPNSKAFYKELGLQ